MKNIKFIKHITFIVFTVVGLCMSSCTPIDEYKEKFLEDGIITYPGKIKSVTANTGNKRIRLDMVLGSDPAVEKILIYWKNKQESQTVDVVQGVSTMEVFIENIEEGLYNFEIFTFDDKGNKSVVTNVTGRVLGDTFTSTLLSRQVLWAACGVVSFGATSEGMIGVEIKYTNLDGEETTVNVENDETITTLPDADTTFPIEYRTSYLPEGSVDLFYSETESFPFQNGIGVSFESGLYEVTSLTINSGNLEGWMPQLGQTRMVTKVSDTEFSYQHVTSFGVTEAATILVDPDTNAITIPAHLSSNFSNDWFHLRVESVPSNDNFACGGVFTYKVRVFSETPAAVNAAVWGEYTYELTRQL